MKNQIGKEAIIKIVECILQSRIDVKKQQIRTFDKVNKQINKNRQEAFNSNINHFLNNLLISQLFGIRKKFKCFKNFFSVRICFKLVEKKKGRIILAQLWQIILQQFCQIEPQNHKQEFVMISNTIQELLLFLNRQPLFSQYQKNSHLKSQYMLDYQFKEYQTKKVKNLDNIINFSNKYAKDRTCKSLSIGIVSYFIPKFDKLDLSSKNKLLFHQKQQSMRDSLRKTIDNTQEIQIDKEEQTGKKKSQHNRRVSLYQVFDNQLDFVFLTSDDQSFKKKQKTNIKQIQIEDDYQEFELLMISKEQEFIQENKSILSQLASNQLSYFQL